MLETIDTLPLQNLAPQKSPASAQNDAAMGAAAVDFEAVFIAEMLKPMFEGIATDGMFGGGKAEEVFRGMLLQEYGKIVAQTSGIGIAAEVKQTLIELQAAQGATQTDQTDQTDPQEGDAS
ncbi:MAG: rod-binding protein [Bdellovibrionales bacterium]